MSYSQNKVRVEKTLVEAGNIVLPAGGTPLINTTSGVVALANGQLAIVDASGNGTNTRNTSLTAGDTVINSPIIAIYQGTPDSAQLGSFSTAGMPLPNRPFEKSHDIIGSTITLFKGKAYASPTSNCWVVGGATSGGGATAVNLQDNTVYELTLTTHGRRTDIINGRNMAAIFPQYTTPFYTALGYTALNQRDDLMQNMAYQVLQASNLYPNTPGGNQEIAIAINELATGNAHSVVTISGLTVGTTLVLYTGVDATISLTLNQDQVTTLQSLIVANGGPIANTAVIETVNLTTAGFGNANVDRLAILALNEQLAFFDRIAQVKPRVVVGLRQGFNPNTVYLEEVSVAFEGEGLARQWQLYYDETDDLRKYGSSQYPGAYVIDYPSPIVANTTYNVYIIYHFDRGESSDGEQAQSAFLTNVLIPTGDTISKASFEAVINPYVVSLNLQPVNL